MEAEAATYNALFSSILNLQAWAMCGTQPAVVLSQQAQAKVQTQQQQQQQPKYPAPTGWTTTKVITLPGLSDGKLVNIPTAVVLQDTPSHTACAAANKKGATSSSQLLVLMRGALLQTDYSWYAFASSLVEAPEVGPGLLHQGAVNASGQVWSNGLQQALDDALASPCPPSSITLAGHSFGGAGATLLAPRVARYVQQKPAAATAAAAAAAAAAALPLRKALPAKLLGLIQQHGSSQPPLVSAVMFGAPPVSDAAYAAYFNRMVNTRRLEFELDPYNVIFKAWTPVPGGKPDPRFATVGGVIRWGPAAMPLQQQQWIKLAATPPGSPKLQQQLRQASGQTIGAGDALGGAVHACSYMCKTASYAGITNNWCLLHSEPSLAGKTASYCYSRMSIWGGSMFPTTPAFP
uniref:Fungal lipase-type domain-containing protein n=1 Tax=Tetradesmus obliquus TaxID=3088 RepID=A0A383VRT0_TETOB|eukprot:jgi/Sobl393_1/1959/SZX67600.1